MSTLYGHREQDNNERFDQLADTLSHFRNTVQNDIQGSLQSELGLLDSLNDNFSLLWIRVKRSSGDLSTTMRRNLNISRIVAIVLVLFFIAWMIYKVNS